MEAETVPIGALREDAHNTRIHSTRNLEAIKSSLERFGQQKPIVVDEDDVVRAGNGTLAAARALGWREISVVRSHLSGAEMTAYAIADNRTAELAEWNREALASALQQLKSGDSTEGTGFSPREAERALLRLPSEIQEGTIPEEPEEVDVLTQRGDVWLLGEHRLMCGDSSSSDDWQQLMGGELAEMAFADPPYDLHDHQVVQHIAAHTRDAYIFVMCADNQVQGILGEARDAEMFCDRFFVMDISFCVPTGIDAYIQHILVARLRNGSPPPLVITGDGLRTILPMKYRGRISEEERQPHQQPIETVAGFIRHYSTDEGLIVDPFVGSGTTIAAAQQLGRRCYGMEINPTYCEVAVKRWELLTGEEAELLCEGVC